MFSAIEVNTAARDKTEKNALHYCAENSTSACAEIILDEAPYLLSEKDEDGYTPLHLAVIGGNLPVTKFLLKKGADVNAVDNEKHTSVHWATVCGQIEVMDILIEHNAALSSPDVHEAYPIHYASQMSGSASDVDPAVGLAVLNKLISKGVPVDCMDKDKRQPLLWAASAGSKDACRILIKAGAKVDACDKDGLTAMHCAASRGHPECIEALQRCGGNIDCTDKNSCTPLFYAITLGHDDCTSLLLNLGANPNFRDKRGRSPAHCAAAKGSKDSIRFLRNKKADFWISNLKKEYPIHEAAQAGHTDILKTIVGKSGENIKYLDQGNQDGRTCLHLAGMTNNLELCKYLLDNKANINAIMKSRSQKERYITPLDVARIKGNKEIGEYLESNGAVKGSRVINHAASTIENEVNQLIDEKKQTKELDKIMVVTTGEEVHEKSTEEECGDGVLAEDTKGQEESSVRGEEEEATHSGNEDVKPGSVSEAEEAVEETDKSEHGDEVQDENANIEVEPAEGTKVQEEATHSGNEGDKPGSVSEAEETVEETDKSEHGDEVQDMNANIEAEPLVLPGSRSSSPSRSSLHSRSRSRLSSNGSHSRSPSPSNETLGSSHSTVSHAEAETQPKDDLKLTDSPKPASSPFGSVPSENKESKNTEQKTESFPFQSRYNDSTSNSQKGTGNVPPRIERGRTALSLKSEKENDSELRAKTRRRPKTARSKIAEKVQASVKQYTRTRQAVRELHSLKRTQIHQAYYSDDVILKKFLENHKSSSKDESKEMDIHSLSEWERHLCDQIKILTQIQPDKPPTDDTHPLSKDRKMNSEKDRNLSQMSVDSEHNRTKKESSDQKKEVNGKAEKGKVDDSSKTRVLSSTETWSNSGSARSHSSATGDKNKDRKRERELARENEQKRRQEKQRNYLRKKQGQTQGRIGKVYGPSQFPLDMFLEDVYKCNFERPRSRRAPISYSQSNGIKSQNDHLPMLHESPQRPHTAGACPQMRKSPRDDTHSTAQSRAKLVSGGHSKYRNDDLVEMNGSSQQKSSLKP